MPIGNESMKAVKSAGLTLSLISFQNSISASISKPDDGASLRDCDLFLAELSMVEAGLAGAREGAVGAFR